MKRPLLMGIVNCTPDSFSGDGSLATEAVLAQVDTQLAGGAAIIDLGAESTRPGATDIGDDEEWRRLEPVLHALAMHPERSRFQLSLDSYRSATITKAIRLGVDVVNDVSGLRDEAVLKVLAAWHGKVVVMHALSVPADPAVVWETTVDAIAEILRWRQEMLARAMAAGIAMERLVFDPGIGFGKTPAQSLELIARAPELVKAGGYWLVGHSRKSFLKALAADPAARDDATLALSAVLAQSGVQILRVHAVARHTALLDALCM